MIDYSFKNVYSDGAVSKVHIHHQHQEKPLKIDRDIHNFVSCLFSELWSKPLLQRFAGVLAEKWACSKPNAMVSVHCRH